MVIRLQRPAVDDVKLVDKVVNQRLNGRNREFFNRIRTPWRERVEAYIQACGNPELVTPWTEAVRFKSRFLNLYNSPQASSVQKPILEKLRERTLQMCPACGEDGTPNTLDHYLPKNDFPDFAVAAVNLFPMCDTCQGWKLEQTLSENGRRLFLHPYFDGFLEQQVLHLTIGEPYYAPASIELTPVESLSPALKDLVARHIKYLGISSRYYHFFREQYTHLLGSAADIRDAELNMRQQLTLFRNQARRKSVNSWGHVFYESVLSNHRLVSYLETAELPALEPWAQALTENRLAP